MISNSCRVGAVPKSNGGYGLAPRQVLKVCLLPNWILMAFSYILSRFATGCNSGEVDSIDFN